MPLERRRWLVCVGTDSQSQEKTACMSQLDGAQHVTAHCVKVSQSTNKQLASEQRISAARLKAPVELE
jgi:hypothetical protein